VTPRADVVDGFFASEQKEFNPNQEDSTPREVVVGV